VAGLQVVQPSSQSSLSVANPSDPGSLSVQNPDPYGQLGATNYNPQGAGTSPQTTVAPASGGLSPTPTTTPTPTNTGYTATNGTYYANTNPAVGQNIEKGYQNVLDTLDGIIQQLPGRQQALQGNVDSNYNTSAANNQTAYNEGNHNLDESQNELSNATGMSLRQLAQNMRSQFGSYDTALGAQGAGDSSATGQGGQLSYALTKAENQNKATILNSQDIQNNQIQLKRDDLGAQLKTQQNSLDQWKKDQYQQVTTQFQTALDSLKQQKAGTGAQEATALAYAAPQLANQAVAQIAGINNTFNDVLAKINGGLTPPTSNSSAINASYTPTALPSINLPALQTGTPTSSFSNGNQNVVASAPVSAKYDQFGNAIA
jgi:molybdopterin converting factor small subunit